VLNATIAYDAIARNYSRTLARTATEPTAVRQTEYFKANIGKVKSTRDLINNSRLYSYGMKAFGLSDMMYAKGLIQKILEGEATRSSSLANTLHDPRYLALAETFNFAADGANATSPASLQQATISNYIEQTLKANAGQKNQGAQMALNFQRMPLQIMSAYSILADKMLLQVVETALGLPASLSQSPIDQQAKEISQESNVADFKDPSKLQKFIERFTANYDFKISAPTTPLTALFDNSGSVGINSSLLLNLANLRLGGF